VPKARSVSMKTRIYCCFGIAILAGCVTPRPAAKTAAPAKRDIIEKAQDKPAETASSPKTAETAAVKPPTAQELWKFLKSQSKADAAWGDAERDLAARMKNEPDA